MLVCEELLEELVVYKLKQNIYSNKIKTSPLFGLFVIRLFI